MTAFHPSRYQATLTILLGSVLLQITALGAQFALHGMSERYSMMIDTRIHTVNKLNQVNLLFKTQGQEWKNTLLRGHDPELENSTGKTSKARKRKWTT